MRAIDLHLLFPLLFLPHVWHATACKVQRLDRNVLTKRIQEQRNIFISSTRLYAAKQIDPLDGLKESPRKPSSNIKKEFTRENSVPGIAKPDLETELLKSEMRRRERLSSEFFTSFICLLDQIVPRISLVALTFHVMLLLPTLRFLIGSFKVESITPFLYIGPLVLAIPYLVYFLWEYDVMSVSVIDNKLKDVLVKQKQIARELLDDQERMERLVESATCEIETKFERTRGDFNRLVLARLVAKVDPDVFYTDIVSYRSRLTSSGFSKFVLTKMPVGLLTIILNRQSKNPVDDNLAVAVKELLAKIYISKNSGSNSDMSREKTTKEVLLELREMSDRLVDPSTRPENPYQNNEE